MGAGGGRASRRLIPAPDVAVRPPAWRWRTPVVGAAAAILLAIVTVSAEQVVGGAEGPWVEVGAGACAALFLLGTVGLGSTAVARYRDGFRRRALGWAAGFVSALVATGFAIFIGVLAAQVGSVLSGADTHATAPVLHGLPRPPGATLIDERPGPAGTESVSDDFRVPDLAAMPNFYRAALVKADWLEDSASTETSLLRFHRGQFEVSILVDVSGAPPAHQPGDYSITVDRAPATPSASPS